TDQRLKGYSIFLNYY
uniref:Uncharacterized protein n=1 Tax=Amphimedon queenslandica TaxID=400682 RepID=A0A1X7UVR3_AMPQE